MQENTKEKKGFTLLIAIITTSMMVIVAFVVVNIAVQQLILSNSARQSQYAFYAADGGTECAVYWDLKDPTLSKFDPTTPGTISCHNQTISTGTETVPTIPSQPSVIGGASVSIFEVNFIEGCAIVKVTKSGGNTTIDSRGYNTCDTSSASRFERGVTLSY